MNKMSDKIKVALIFGGRSAEHEISLASASAIHKNMDPGRFEVIPVYINKQGLWKKVEAPSTDERALNRGQFLSFLPWQPDRPPAGIEADIYFPILHGPFGEDGTIQGLLDLAGVPYVGSGVAASAIGMDKVLSKILLQAQGLPIVPFMVLSENDWQENPGLNLRRLKRRFKAPFFVKPIRLGSSVGITKVSEYASAAAALDTAFSYDTDVLIEESIDGREIECSVLGNERAEASVPGEIIPYREFYDYRDKYVEGKTRFVVPAALPAPTADRIRRLAARAFEVLGCSGFARVDFFVQKKTGRIYINEINTIPGFTEISMFPRLWQASGLSFGRLVEKLIDLGFERHRNRKQRVDLGRI